MAASKRRTGMSAQQRRERAARLADVIPENQKRLIVISTTTETPVHLRARGVDLEPELREYARARSA